MIEIIPAWLGDGKYQLDINTNNHDVTSVDVYVTAYRQLYYVGTTSTGQSIVSIPPEVPYGPILMHAIGRNPGGSVVDTGPGHYTIHEGDRSSSPFWVQLSRDEMTVAPHDDTVSGYRMRVTVTDASGLPKKLFLFKLNRDWKYDVGDEFQGVCRPGDFDHYPEEQPDPEGVFFRKAYVDVTTPVSSELEDLWKHLRRDVNQLIRTMETNSVLETKEVVTLRG